MITAGEEARALVTFEVSHAPQTPPTDTSIYKIPKKLDRQLTMYVGTSPGIETRHPKIIALAKQLVADKETAWQQVEAIYDWVMTNIQPNKGELKGAARTLIEKKGDPEDMASLFIALCRASKIPARTVWVPQHVYPEFYLLDDDDHGHWFPCQTDGPRSFGGITETGPILLKGDNFHDAERPREKMRLVPEFFKGTGSKSAGTPKVQFVRESGSGCAARAVSRIRENETRRAVDSLSPVHLIHAPASRLRRAAKFEPGGVEDAWFVEPLVGVGAEVIALGLQQVGRQPGAAIAVEIGQRRRGGRNPNAQVHRRGDDLPPGRLSPLHLGLEVRGQEQVFQVSDRHRRPL